VKGDFKPINSEKVVMIELKMNRQLRFSIIVIIFATVLFLSTISLPWISLRDMGNGAEEFHLNYEMMAQSIFPEISQIANNVNSINVLLMFIVFLGLFSLLATTYHVASKTCKLGFYMIIFSNIIIILTSLLIVYKYFSVIFYINDVAMISLSSPIPYFSYCFISLIGSVVFASISGVYGGYISIFTIFQYKEIRHEMKKFSGLPTFSYKPDDKQLDIEKCRQENISGMYSVTEKNDELPVFSGDNPEELRFENTDEFDEGDEEFIIEESEDENIEEETDEKEIKIVKHKQDRIPFSFDKPIEKLKNPVVDKKEKKEQKLRSPFSFDKPVEKLKNPVVNKKENKEQKLRSPFSFDNKVEKAPSQSTIDKKEEHVKDEEGANEFGKLSQNLQNKKSLEIIEQGRREAQVDMQKDIDLNPQPSENRSLKKDGSSQENLQINIDLDKKSISVMCPKCKNIFSITKTSGVTSIKCPVCGKEGIIR